MSYRIGLAVVGTFRSTADAEVAKGVLAGVGVDALIRSDNAGGMYPALSPAELLVRTDDAARAKDALTRAPALASLAKSQIADTPDNEAIRELREAMIRKKDRSVAADRRRR